MRASVSPAIMPVYGTPHGSDFVKRSPLWIILLVAFVDLIGFGLIIPLQAVYAERLGASGLTFGLLVGVYSLMQLVFNPLLGRWSDRVGRRRVLLISISGSMSRRVLSTRQWSNRPKRQPGMRAIY